MKRVLVTGGAGFIGSHLVERLAHSGYEPLVLDDFSSGRPENLHRFGDRVEIVRGSILDAELVECLARGCACIFHLAAVVSVPRSLEDPKGVHNVNVTGTLNVLEAARKAGPRVVLSSSAAVYGDGGRPTIDENSPTFPISPYGSYKLAAEHYAGSYHRSYGIETINLRYFNVYGPRQDPKSPYSGVISVFMKQAQAGERLTIHGEGDQTRDFVFVDDVVDANLAAMEAARANGLAINIGTGRAVDLRSLAAEVLRATGQRSEIVKGPKRHGDILHSCSDPRLARELLGWSARTSLSEGLKRMSQEALSEFGQPVGRKGLGHPEAF